MRTVSGLSIEETSDSESLKDALVHSIVRDWRSAPLQAADRALCHFATELTLQQSNMTARDLDRLRAHGFDDRAIHNAAQVIAYFNYITLIAHALRVEPENFLQAWGNVE